MQHALDQSPALPMGMSSQGLSSATKALLVLFIVGLLIPSSWEIAGLRLSTARIYALCMVIPLAIRWLAQDAGRVLPVDTLIFLHGLWIIVSLFVNHGPSQIANSGMTFVEMFCGYLVGRILIRDAVAFKFLFQILLAVLACLLPFAAYEMLTERAILQEIFRSLLGSSFGDVYHPPRLGLYRAQTVMQHPILWGVFCCFVVANAVYIWSDRLPGAVVRLGIAGVACCSSLSSGAVLAAIVQVLLMVWGWLTKGAWKPLLLGFIGVYVFLSFASNRGPIILMVETLTFDSNTGWTRVHIWRHGIDDALANPIFGIGLHEHSRPFWLSPSVDNFWLVMMMRHGFVGFGLLATALGWHLWQIVRADGLSDYEKRLRQGYLIVLVSLFFSLGTVHIWGPPYLLLFAYIGGGAWFYVDRPRAAAPNDAVTADARDGEGTTARARPGARALPFARTFASEPSSRPASPEPTRPQVPSGTVRPIHPPAFSRDHTHTTQRSLSAQGRKNAKGLS